MNDLERIEREIDTLLEANRHNWHELATAHMEPARRRALKQQIAARDIELFDLIERKWDLTPRHA